MSAPIIAHAKLSGSSEFLQEIAATGFALNTLCPLPDEDVSENIWRYVHWGTIQELSDIVIDYTQGATTMTVSFRAADEVPFSMFMYIAKKYPGIELCVNYDVNNCEVVGHISSTGDAAKCTLQWITPIFYSDNSLRRFAETSAWFDAEEYLALLAKRGIRRSNARCDMDIYLSEIVSDYDTHVADMEEKVDRSIKKALEIHGEGGAEEGKT